MTYTSDIPAPSGDTLGGTRDRIRTNFQQIATVAAVNHIAFNASGQGKHKFLQMPEQPGSIGQVGAPLPPTTAADEGGLYTKVGINPAETNLVFRAESDGFEYQLTKVIAASTGRFGNNTVAYVANNNGGWTFLPGGLLLQYGRRTSPGSSGTVTFPVAFPSGNAPFSIVVTNERNSARSANIDNSAISATSFDYFMETSGSVALNWIAIGN